MVEFDIYSGTLSKMISYMNRKRKRMNKNRNGYIYLFHNRLNSDNFYSPTDHRKLAHKNTTGILLVKILVVMMVLSYLETALQHSYFFSGRQFLSQTIQVITVKIQRLQDCAVGGNLHLH